MDMCIRPVSISILGFKPEAVPVHPIGLIIADPTVLARCATVDLDLVIAV